MLSVNFFPPCMCHMPSDYHTFYIHMFLIIYLFSFACMYLENKFVTSNSAAMKISVVPVLIAVNYNPNH